MRKDNSKKGEKEHGKEGPNDIFSSLKDAFAGILLSKVNDLVKGTIHNVQDAIYLVVKKILESVLALAVMIFGLGMIIFSLPFMLSLYTGIPASFFFVMIGLLLLLISLISFIVINRTKYYKEK